MSKKTFDMESAVAEEALRDAHLLREENTRLRRELGRVQRNENSIISEVRNALADLPSVTPPKPPKRDTRRLHDEVAWLMLSDTQIGKVTPSYNVEVAERRVMKCAETLVEITNLRRKAARVEECVVVLGGDMVEGEAIFSGQPYEIELGAMQQSVQAAPQAFARALRFLAGHFPRVRVDCVVGNHGRVGPLVLAQHPKTNWDRVTYEVTAMLVADVPNIDFNVAEDFWTCVEVLGWGNLVVHGDQIGGAGTDGPIARAAMGWQDAIPTDWSYLWMGHFHNARWLTVNKRTVLVNGSTESDNLYAQRKLKAMSDPMQWAAFFGEKHGLISLVPVYLT
jgi:hypothetical protein